MKPSSRVLKEIALLESDPPTGVSAWLDEAQTQLHGAIVLLAQISGPSDTPYERGMFNLEVQVAARYPNEPPRVRFLTPIYHPNIDTGGRICLDTLNMPPKGSWTPANSLRGVLTQIRLLIEHPNPSDPLMPEISAQYKNENATFVWTAREWTRTRAQSAAAAAASAPASSSSAAALPIPTRELVVSAVSVAPSPERKHSVSADAHSAPLPATAVPPLHPSGGVRRKATPTVEDDAPSNDDDSDSGVPVHRRRRRRRPLKRAKLALESKSDAPLPAAAAATPAPTAAGVTSAVATATPLTTVATAAAPLTTELVVPASDSESDETTAPPQTRPPTAPVARLRTTAPTSSAALLSPQLPVLTPAIEYVSVHSTPSPSPPLPPPPQSSPAPYSTTATAGAAPAGSSRLKLKKRT